MSFDADWEAVYAGGRSQRYPWDSVVSFVFGYAPKGLSREQVKIMEVGCGTASNLWFAAREGFSVYGIEGSESAVRYAQERFEKEGLSGDIRVGDFTVLPFEDDQFDMVIDRGALTCVNDTSMAAAVSEVLRTMKPGGIFHFNPYADSHSGLLEGIDVGDGLTRIPEGASSMNPGLLNFVSRKRLEELFHNQHWEILSIQRREDTEMYKATQQVHSEWLLLAKKRVGE